MCVRVCAWTRVKNVHMWPNFSRKEDRGGERGEKKFLLASHSDEKTRQILRFILLVFFLLSS